MQGVAGCRDRPRHFRGARPRSRRESSPHDANGHPHVLHLSERPQTTPLVCCDRGLRSRRRAELATDHNFFDPLQIEGTASLLDRLLQMEGAHHQDDTDEVLAVRHWIGAHPEGAIVLLVLDAESLVIAETAARDALQQVLERREHLADWLIDTCEVGFNQQFVDAGLQAADGPEVPPADPADRARWLAEQSQPPIGMAGSDAEIDWRKYVIDHASQLRAFNLDVFDAGDDEDTAKLAAGALIFACTLVIDELFQDIATLAKSKSAVADTDDVFMVLDDLPERFAQHYTGRFARQFLVAAVDHGTTYRRRLGAAVLHSRGPRPAPGRRERQSPAGQP